MTTSTTISETTKRNLTVFDLANGARVVGESVQGLDNCIINPTILTIEKEKDSEQVKLSLNPILFTSGALYRVQPQAMIAAYQCFDTTIHNVYERTLKGGTTDAGSSDGTNAPAETTLDGPRN